MVPSSPSSCVFVNNNGVFCLGKSSVRTEFWLCVNQRTVTSEVKPTKCFSFVDLDRVSLCFRIISAVSSTAALCH